MGMFDTIAIKPKSTGMFDEIKPTQGMFDDIVPTRSEVTAGIEQGDYGPLSRLAEAYPQEPLPEEMSPVFDAESGGYDYAEAKQAGLAPDETGHWPSRIPETGLLLKGRKHPTWNQTVEEEENKGYTVVKRGDRYYSIQQPPVQFEPVMGGMQDTRPLGDLRTIEQQNVPQGPPKIGFTEAFIEDPAKFVPFFGSVVQIDRLMSVKEAAERLEQNKYIDIPQGGRTTGYAPAMGRPVKARVYESGMTADEQRQQDAKTVSDWMNEAEEKKIRGYSFGGRVGQILGEMPAYMGEIALTAGLYAGPKKVTEKAILGQLKKRVASGTARRIARKTAVPVAGWAVGGVIQGTAQPQRIAKTYVERRMPRGVATDEQGQIQFQWPDEKPLSSFVNAWGDTVIEIASEQSGAAVTHVLGKLPFGGKLMRRLYSGYDDLHPGRFSYSQFVDRMSNRVAFNGMIGELGEEYIGDQLRAITNVSDFGADQQTQQKYGRDANILERMNAAFQQDVDMTPEMAVSFAVPGAARFAGSKAAAAVDAAREARSERKAKEVYEGAVERTAPRGETVPLQETPYIEQMAEEERPETPPTVGEIAERASEELPPVVEEQPKTLAEIESALQADDDRPVEEIVRFPREDQRELAQAWVDAQKEAADERREPVSSMAATEPTQAPSEGEKINTIAGRMSYLEFERSGYAPEEVTRDEWVALQRSERRRLGQEEGGDSPNAPWAEYEEYHKRAVKDALARGEEVDDRVLADYPDLKRTPEKPQSLVDLAIKLRQIENDNQGQASSNDIADLMMGQAARDLGLTRPASGAPGHEQFMEQLKATLAEYGYTGKSPLRELMNDLAPVEQPRAATPQPEQEEVAPAEAALAKMEESGTIEPMATEEGAARQEPSPSPERAGETLLSQTKAVDDSGRPVRVFHGTVHEFDEFDPGKFVRGAARAHVPGAIYFTDSEELAADYARGDVELETTPVTGDELIALRKSKRKSASSQKGSLTELPAGAKVVSEWMESPGRWVQGDLSLHAKDVKGQNFRYAVYLADGTFVTHSDSTESAEKAKENAIASLNIVDFDAPGYRQPYGKGSRVVSAYLDIRNPLIVDMHGEPWGGKTKETIEKAKKAGHDGVIIRNVVDNADPYRKKPQTTYVVFSPSQIKQAESKSFDPAAGPETPGAQPSQPTPEPSGPTAKTPTEEEPSAVAGAAPKAIEETERTPDRILSDKVADHLKTGKSLDAKTFFAVADESYGGTRAEGAYQPSDAYDALELGVNKYFQEISQGITLSPTYDFDIAKRDVEAIEKVLGRLPTQANRSGEKDLMQQFSTPPHYAYAAAWVANIGENDVVLEPSAGVGGIAVFAKNAGATVHVNELSVRRANLLRELGFDKITSEDAEQIHNILEDRPSVVLMNPPFSHAAHRMGGKKIMGTDRKHVDAALNLLQDGGRLVAIMGRPMQVEKGESQAFRWWVDSLKEKHNVRANVYVGRGVYKKYGTNFPTRLLVIDKTGPTTGEIKGGKVDTIDELLYTLRGVRNDREPIQQIARQPSGERRPAPTRTETRPEPPVRSPVGRVGPEEPRPRRPYQPRTERPTGAGERNVRVESEPRPEASGQRATGEPGRPGITGPESERKPVSEPRRVQTGAEGGVSATTQKQAREKKTELTEAVFESYQPAKFYVPGAKKHPTALVESTAMASVDPPDIAYDLTLPQSVIDKGQLSNIQLENVAYAGMAFEGKVKLGNGNEVRRGFLIGDGTGVGKGREISGIILDQYGKGRKKAVWVSKNDKLFSDAQRDWSALGQDKKKLFNLGSVKAGTQVQVTDGIMYVTYGKLRSTSKKTQQRTIDQIIDWVGEDFDGVLVFDEAHHMGNAIAVRGERGTKKPSQTAVIAAELRNKLPNARVVYVSATAATEVINLAYTERLGLWGPGTPFPNVVSFVSEISSSGINAMEQVARDMKAMGLFFSRSLSYDDGTEEGTVRFGALEHKLTPEQQTVYDKVAEAWQIVLQNLNRAIAATQMEDNGRSRGQAMSQFWGANQRFFNQIITAMKVPAVVKEVEKDLAEGRSAVIQLTSTYEAAQERALAARTKDDDLEDFDLTPVEILMQYVDHSFPTQQYESYIDENGNKQARPVVDSKGDPVENREAVAMKERLLDELGSIRNIVPESPLDTVINHFGSDVVAEATGRSRRVILKKGKRIIERRGKHANQAETDAFMNGKKRVLIFSEAGGTGASYHADMDSKNQQRRAHYVLQPGWRADVCLQGMGRTHRSNQRYAPWYKLATTNLNGEKRFTSTISRRLNQLGALQFGERKAGSVGLFSAADNLESEQARDALHTFFVDLVQGRIPNISLREFETQTGLKLTTETGGVASQLPDIRQFLNRLLNLKIDFQNEVFDAFQRIHQEKVDQAEAEGRLDLGVQNYPADEVIEEERQTVYTHPTGGTTEYVKVTSKYRIEAITWDDLQRHWKPEFYVQSSHGKVYGVKQASSHRDARSGQVTQRYRLIGQTKTGSHFIEKYKIDAYMGGRTPYGERQNWKEVTRQEAKSEWDTAVDELPEFKEREEHFISGLMVPIWNRLRGEVKLFRLLTKEGNVFIGRKIPSKEIQTTLKSLGLEAKRPKLSEKAAVQGVLQGQHKLELANGWKLKYARVGGEARIELIGPSYEHQTELADHGVFFERIQYKTRWFLPTGDQAETVYQSLTGQYPVVNVEYLSGEDPTIDVPSAQGGFVGGRPSRTAAQTKLSAIVKEDMRTGSAVADAVMKENRGHHIKPNLMPGLRVSARQAVAFGREFHFLPHLPKTSEFAEVREAIRHSMEIAKKASTDAAEAMKWCLAPMKGVQREVTKRYEALMMKLIADDAMEDLEKGIPLGVSAITGKQMEEADVVAMKAKADELYAKYPSVRQAYDRIRQKTAEITDMLVGMGWLKKEVAREYYFPHRVIKYLQQNRAFFGVPRKLAMPRRKYLDKRKGGNAYAVDLDYMVEHWGQVRRDIAMTEFLEKTLRKEQQDHFKKEYPDWKYGDPVPAGFREVTVLPGRFYYRANGVTEDLAMALVNQNLAQIEAILETKGEKGLDAVRTVLAIGRKRSFIVREQIANQVEDMPTAPMVGEKGAAAAIYNAVKYANTFVKRQILFNPLYAVPFHVTNFVGDAHKVAVALPGALKSRHMPGYWQAILDAHNGRKPQLFDDAQEYGVIGSGWIGVDVKNLKALLPEIARAEISGAGEVAWQKAKRAFNLLKTAGESREDWLRYATFAHLVDLQNKGMDIVKYATKDTKVVKGLSGHEQAAKIARDILGDYLAIGKSGRILSDTLIPFYRWMHLNLPWWPRLINEYGRRGNAGRIAAALLAAAAPYVAAMLWNYGDDDRRRFERRLPPWKRYSFHVVGLRGRKLYYIPLPLDDLIQFFGIDNSLADFQVYNKGYIDMPTLTKRIAMNFATDPMMGGINAIGGVAAIPRDIAGIKTFPEFADYRIKDPKRRAVNVAKDIFGAPGQLAEAIRREDDTKIHDLLWRGVLGIPVSAFLHYANLLPDPDAGKRSWVMVLTRPWTPTSQPVTVLASNTYKESREKHPGDPSKWEAHKGQSVKVDRLRVQVDDMSPGEVKSTLQQWELEQLTERWNKRLKQMNKAELSKALNNHTYQRYARASKSNKWTARFPGDPHEGDEEIVKLIQAEMKRRAQQ